MKTTIALMLCLTALPSLLATEPERDPPKPWPYRFIQNETLRLQQQGWIIIRAQIQGKGRGLIYAVTREQMIRTPKWDGMRNPPLEISRAIAIAEAYEKTILQENEQIRLMDITLERVSAIDFTNPFGEQIDDRWIYVVKFYRSIEHGQTVGWEYDSTKGSTPVYVMMDGSVVAPRQVFEE